MMTARFSNRGRSRWMAAALLVVAANAKAQNKPYGVIRVVGDSGNVSVVAAEVTFTATDGRVIARGSTNDRGEARLVVDDSSLKRLRLSVRRIGYRAVQQEIVAPFNAIVLLQPTAARLDEVRVDAGVLRSKQNYFISGDDIARSSRGLFDALDVVKKLRPEMRGDANRLCPNTNKLWINGRRVYFDATGNGVVGRLKRSPFPRYNTLDTVLASIKSEHVAEMRYINCWDTPPDGLQQDAIYIVLRPGVEWDWKHGSFVGSTARP
jgi:hypothetical protein